MPELDITWGRVIHVWWLIVWRGGLGAMLFAAIFGAIVGVVGELTRTTGPVTNAISFYSGSLIWVLWAIVVVRMALRKQYGEFRFRWLFPNLSCWGPVRNIGHPAESGVVGSVLVRRPAEGPTWDARKTRLRFPLNLRQQASG